MFICNLSLDAFEKCPFIVETKRNSRMSYKPGRLSNSSKDIFIKLEAVYVLLNEVLANSQNKPGEKQTLVQAANFINILVYSGT